MGGAPPLPFSLSLSLCVCLSQALPVTDVLLSGKLALYPNTPASDVGESSAARVLNAGTFVCCSALLVCSFSLFSFCVAHRHLLTRPSCRAETSVGSGSSLISSLVPCACERALIGGDDWGKQRSGDGEGPHAGQRLRQVWQGGAGQASAPAPLQVSQSVHFCGIQHWTAQKGEGNEPDICCGVCLPGMEMISLALWCCINNNLSVWTSLLTCCCYLACRLKLFI